VKPPDPPPPADPCAAAAAAPLAVGAAPATDGSRDEIGFTDPDVLWLSGTTLNRRLDAIAATGATWLRFDFHWPFIQPESSECFDWSRTDRVVSAAQARGLAVVAVLDYTPACRNARLRSSLDHSRGLLG